MKNPAQAETLWIKPAQKGLLVPYPGRGRRMLPKEGAQVRLNTWWRARLRDGDVERIQEPKSTATKKAAEAKPTN